MQLAKRQIIRLIAIVFAGMLTAPLQAAPFFTGLGELPGMRTDSTTNGFDNVVSNDGTTVVGRAMYFGGTEAFRWTQAGGMQALGDIAGGGFFSEAFSASGDGSAVVGRGVSAFGFEAFRWTQAGGMQGLGQLGGFHSEAHSVSADGSVVVGFSARPVDREEAFRWTQAGGMQGLGILNGGNLSNQAFSSQAWSTSADGSVVVGSSASPKRQYLASLTPGLDLHCPDRNKGNYARAGTPRRALQSRLSGKGNHSASCSPELLAPLLFRSA